MTAPSPEELFPIHGVRFRNGRTFHSVKKPTSEDGWHDYLEAACGQIGLQATGYACREVSRCKGCKKVFGEAEAAE